MCITDNDFYEEKEFFLADNIYTMYLYILFQLNLYFIEQKCVVWILFYFEYLQLAKIVSLLNKAPSLIVATPSSFSLKKLYKNSIVARL